MRTRHSQSAYLYSDLGADDRIAAEAALIMLLDDPSPQVRIELARTLAFSELLDTDLVDAVATGTTEVQLAIANRGDLPPSVSAAIAEVGSAEACLVLTENPHAKIAAFSFERMAARFGHLAAIREAMVERDDLPAAARQKLIGSLLRR